jgi:NAD(P)-dependent dehydrogenase (short-subunit alcohol dehydrogenase family)
VSRVVVTGGSSGIGLATVHALLDAGHEVSALGRRSLDAFREAVRPEAAGRIAYRAADLAGPDHGLEAFGELVAERGGLDVLVNNAGVMAFEAAHEQGAELVERLLAVDLAAPIVLAGAAVKAMLPQGSGHVINIASVAGLKATPKLSAYGAAKAGLVHYTRCLAAEYAGRGIRANAVCPGAAKTNLASRVMFAMIQKSVPLGQLQTPGEIARLVVWLVSDDARNVTGSILSLDGGMSL